MRRDFMADVSHELRTPLAVLRGELEALQDGLRQPTPESLSSLQAEVAILTKLVNDLHQLSQSDRGALAYRKTQLDVVRLLQVAIASFHGRFQNKKMTITAHLPEHAVILATLTGSISYFTIYWKTACVIPTRGALEIIALIQEETLTLHWQDSKPGVSDEQLERLFERFIVRKVHAIAPVAALGWGWRFAIILSMRIVENQR